jgi:DNA-directed RNA polymerase specialized sigma24 family protein
MIVDADSARQRRDWADTVLMRACWLDAAERALVEQVVGKGVRPHEIAAVSGRSLRTVQRQLNRVIERLMDKEVEHILRAHGDWDAMASSVALAVWVQGCTLRDTARRLGISLHQVRQQVQVVRGLLAADQAGRRRWRRAGSRWAASDTREAARMEHAG